MLKMRELRARKAAGVIVGLVGVLLVSCSQPVDVASVVTTTEIRATVQRLPQLPAGMIYELWATTVVPRDTSILSSQVRSISRFGVLKNDTINTLVDTAGNPIEPTFLLSGDLYQFKSLFVSVERVADPDRSRPANIMLSDVVSGADDQTLRLNFPLSDSLWLAKVRFNMEGITDNANGAGDGSGIWFSSYRVARDTIPDTTAINNLRYVTDTIVAIVIGNDTINLDSLTRDYLYDITNIRPETSFVDLGQDSLLLGIDSLTQVQMTFDRIFANGPLVPNVGRIRRTPLWEYTVEPAGAAAVSIDIFTQDDFGLPDYSVYGWEWRGWVVSPTVPSTATGRLTPPAWTYKAIGFNWIPGDTGGLLTTGPFYRIDSADLDNRYLLPLVKRIEGTDTTFKRPNRPGEDWLNTTLMQTELGISSVNLMPNTSGNLGTVFVTLEPLNKTMDSTNFPLIAFLAALPTARSTITAASVEVNMLNRTPSVSGDQFGTGFPELTITFRRL